MKTIAINVIVVVDKEWIDDLVDKIKKKSFVSEGFHEIIQGTLNETLSALGVQVVERMPAPGFGTNN